jgi:hypothetical protein
MLRALIDGVDLEDLGILLGGSRGKEIEGWLSPPAFARDEAAVGSNGVVLGSRGTMGGRSITIPITVHPSVTTAAARLAAEQQLALWLDRRVRLRIDDGSTAREFVAVLLQAELVPAMPGAPVASAGRLIFRGEGTRWRANEPTLIALTTGVVPVPVTAAPAPRWAIHLQNTGGATTAVTVAIRDRTGELKTSLAVGSIATTEWVELDAGLGLANRWAAGVATSILTTLTGALVTLEPGDTIQLAAGSGTPSGRLLLHEWSW